MPDAIPEVPPGRAPSPAALLALLALYLAVMAVQASLLAPSGRSDDIETLLLSQSLAWGYEPKNPPAFYWLAWAATHAMGPGLPVIYALRLAGVFAAFAGLYAIARRLQPDPWLAACAGFAMLATLHFHWYLLFHLTNTTFAMALAPLAILALFRVRDRPTPASYALLGAVVGLGLLSRYNWAIFAAALAAAALTVPDWRARLFRPAALVSLAVILVMLAPHLVWVARNWPALAGQVEGQILGAEAPPYAHRVLEGAANLAESAVSILIFPLGVLAALCFPRAFRPVAGPGPERASDLALLLRLVLFCLGFMLLYVAAGASYVKPHHLFFLAFAPLWLIARLDAATLAPWRPRAFAGGLAACAGLAAAAYPLVVVDDARGCDACEEFQPVADYAAALRAAGFERGAILALSRRQDFPTAALRGAFPEARILTADYRVYAPPPNAVPGDCLLLWSGADEWPRLWPGAPAAPVPRLGLPLPASARLGAIPGTVRLSGRPAHGLRYALVEGGLGDCR
jgi:4-amino-4-deoxy-L-arabinose transferase-like glycosyltransferase